MEHHHEHSAHEHDKHVEHEPIYKKKLTTNAWVALAVIVGIILFYLLTHHKTYLLDVLPYILILAMILMHIGGHGGHGGHGGRDGRGTPRGKHHE